MDQEKGPSTALQGSTYHSALIPGTSDRQDGLRSIAIVWLAVERRPMSWVFSSRKGNPAPGPRAVAADGEKFGTSAAAQVSRSFSSKSIWNGCDAVLENLLRLLNSLVVRHRQDDHWLLAEGQVTWLPTGRGLVSLGHPSLSSLGTKMGKNA